MIKAITDAIYAKVQTARKLHQTEINAKISAAHAKRTIALKREAADKRIATCENLYGTSGFGLAKFKNTMITRYGAATTLQSDILKTKVQNTNIERYGNITPAANDLVKQKSQKHIKRDMAGSVLAVKQLSISNNKLC